MSFRPATFGKNGPRPATFYLPQVTVRYRELHKHPIVAADDRSHDLLAAFCAHQSTPGMQATIFPTPSQIFEAGLGLFHQSVKMPPFGPGADPFARLLVRVGAVDLLGFVPGERGRIQVREFLPFHPAQCLSHDLAPVVEAAQPHHSFDQRILLFGQCKCHTNKLRPTIGQESSGEKPNGGLDFSSWVLTGRSATNKIGQCPRRRRYHSPIRLRSLDVVSCVPLKS